MITPTSSAACTKPKPAINATQSGENTSPPTLAPLYAFASAIGRCRTYQGAITALMTAPPSSTQPAPLAKAATNNCQGTSASDHPSTPSAATAAPPVVLATMPNRA